MNTTLLRRLVDAGGVLAVRDENLVLTWDKARPLTLDLKTEVADAGPTLKAWAGDRMAPAPPADPCGVCGRSKWWQRKRDLGWACRTCHAPSVPGMEATGGPGAWRSQPWTAQRLVDVMEALDAARDC